MIKSALTLLVTIAIAGMALSAEAKPNKGKNRGPDTHHDAGDALKHAVFTAAERLIIANYAHANPHQFSGLQGLPPGIAKKIRRGGTLPPGIAKRYLPTGLKAQLPRHIGRDYLIVDRDVLLIDIATGVILDILHHAF